MENLRSALEYSAHGIYDKFGDPQMRPKQICFPYANRQQGRTEFQQKPFIRGLHANPQVGIAIEGFQHFAMRDFLWLPAVEKVRNRQVSHAQPCACNAWLAIANGLIGGDQIDC